MHRIDQTVLIATSELSTGSFECHRIQESRLCDAIERLNLSEIIVSEEDDSLCEAIRYSGASITKRPAWMYSVDEGHRLLCKQFAVSTMEGFGFSADDSMVGVAGALLGYINETQANDGTLIHLSPPSIRKDSVYVALDATTIRSLEIEQTIRSHSTEGSLLWVMQRCNTPMGKRLLRNWLCEPLAQKQAIEERQAIVGAFIDENETLRTLRELLGSVQDVARIAGRISMNRMTPRDIVALGSSIGFCDSLAETLTFPPFQSLQHELLEMSGVLNSLANTINTQCVEDPPAHMRAGGLFREGVDDQLDEARMLQEDAGSWLANYQTGLIETTGITTLKVGYNKVFGYYIEVTHAQSVHVPDTFTRKQTLKNAERYITPELKEFEHKVLGAQTQAISREQELYSLLCELISTHIQTISAFAALVATIDVLACFAETAMAYDYTKPTIVEEPIIDIEEGRHPVLDRLLQSGFVPNDCHLGGKSLALITGPNMAGKSTYIRQVALITLLAHTGSFVPAKSATIGVVDRIFTRVGASDELHAGQSTFMVEMVETANILNNATQHSLIILDEIGRGTSTLDGLSLAWAIAEQLANRGCRTLFATHYHELTTLADRDHVITNFHVKVKEWKGDIIFLYRIEKGRSDRSYGIHVAKIAGVPKDVVKRADEILKTLTVHSQQASVDSATNTPAPQMGLFTEYLPSPLLEELKSADLDSMSPMDAFEFLRDLNKRANEG